MDQIVDACHYLLNNYPPAQPIKEYLDSRLSNQAQSKFNFGYFPNSKNIQVLIDLVGQDILIENKLFYSKSIQDSHSPREAKISYFEDYPLVLPYKNTYGKSVALVARTLLSESERKIKQIPKYKNTPESPHFKKGQLLFGLSENKEHILQQNHVYIVEGQFDVIKASEYNIHNIVGLGNNNMTAYQFALITRYTNNIYLLLDNDEAGNKGRSSVIKKFGALANVKNYYVPYPYKDIDEYLTEYKDISGNEIIDTFCEK